MGQSKSLQLFFAGIAALIFSVKIQNRCDWCSIGLIVLSVLLFIWGIILYIKKKKQIKRLKDKGLL